MRLLFGQYVFIVDKSFSHFDAIKDEFNVACQHYSRGTHGEAEGLLGVVEQLDDIDIGRYDFLEKFDIRMRNVAHNPDLRMIEMSFAGEVLNFKEFEVRTAWIFAIAITGGDSVAYVADSRREVYGSTDAMFLFSKEISGEELSETDIECFYRAYDEKVGKS